MKCPCDSGRVYDACCGVYISGIKPAPTALALMRSRYTAYSQANVSYISKTMTGPATEGFDPISSKDWARSVRWLGLAIVNHSAGNATDEVGFVEFIARYQEKNQASHIHERSEFRQIKGRWYYYAGTPFQQKVARNAPCPCGSGKKFKQCCRA